MQEKPPITQPDSHAVARIIAAALEEDAGPPPYTQDLTAQCLIPPEKRGRYAFVAREPLIACGAHIAAQVFRTLDATLTCYHAVADGAAVAQGTPLLIVEGPVRPIMTGERTALNLLQRMCSIATLTAQYVAAISGTSAVILDTRKTMPGLRALDKYAVRAGGGQNHRMGLYDRILIKDNHIAALGGVRATLEQAGDARQNAIVECDTLAQVEEALDAGATHILLDNMAPDILRAAVGLSQLRGAKAKLEASGNVRLETIRAIAETGVDYISVGRLTHSVRNVDIGLDAVDNAVS